MPSQELQWMAVPYDVEQRNGDTILSVAVCITPRLQEVNTANKQLNAYPDWVNWPAKLATVGIALDIDGTVVAANALTPKDDQPDSAVWQAVFPPSTLVRPFEYVPFTDYQILSFPVKNVLQTMQATYSLLLNGFEGEKPTLKFDLDDVDPKSQQKKAQALPKLLQALQDITPNEAEDEKVRSVKRSWQTKGRTSSANLVRKTSLNIKTPTKQIGDMKVAQIPTPQAMMYKPVDVQSKIGSLEMVELFHSSRSFAVDDGKNPKRANRVSRAKPTRPKFDFHQILSVMREYPVMLRQLGLVRHVEFVLPGGMAANGRIRCKITWPSGSITTKTLTPWTAYRLDTSGDAAYWQFLPRPDANSEIVGPVLCLNDDTNYDVIQVDVDTVAMKTLNFTRAIQRRTMITKGTVDANKDDGEPPSIRGTGLQLVRVDRGLKLAKLLVRSAANWNRAQNNQEITLYADDLLRGYRLDVYDDTAKNWQSLMRRNATYTFPLASGSLKTTGISVQDEEGVLTMGATRPPESDDESDARQLYAHETVAQWEGWSLVAPPIGNYIGTEDELAAPNSKQSPPPDFEYQVETAVSIVPKSLPRLRYGRSYRLRARTVDIAGNGPQYDELNPTDFSCATELIRYLRWDPIVSPTLALRKHPVEGESIELMVIRNYNADEDDSVEVPTTEINERHVFPPLAAQQVLERHGLFDTTAVGPMAGDAGMYNTIKSKSADLPSRWYTRTYGGDLIPEATNNKPPADPEKAKTAIRYPLVESGSADTPYLTDPLARTLTLNNVPGMTAGQLKEITLNGETMATVAANGGVVTIAFDDDTSSPSTANPTFKSPSSILLKLAEGTSAPSWDSGSRTLTIFLPKGEQAWITFSSGLGADQSEADANLNIHGHKKTLTDGGQTGTKLKAAARGLSWLVSPSRTLRLVHATQKPLKKPEVKTGSVTRRGKGDTNAEISLTNTYVDARSTQKIDMFAEWPMWVDNLQKPAPELLQQSAYFYEQHCEQRTTDKLSHKKVQEFGDTKYRAVTYVPLATTRFREHMPAAIRNDKNNLTRKGIGKELDVLNSKRPDAVKLLYIVPSFRWLEDAKTFDGTTVKSTRLGGGLRVYMERPWYSSGNGELVGIVLYSTEKFTPSGSGDGNTKGGVKGLQGKTMYQKGAGQSVGQMQGAMNLLAGSKVDIPETLLPYVTQWGLDPIWLSAPTPSDNSPKPANFREPAIVMSNVSLEEVPKSQRFTVIGYEPKFDAERQLWYCDLELNPGESYYPFVRLGLVRLQPKSWSDNTGDDVYCSRVSQSEFCQLAPDREATVRVESDRTSVTVQVVGHTYRTNATGQTGSEMEVTIEKRSAGAGSEDLGWEPVVTQRIDRLPAAGVWGGLLKVPTSVDGTNYRVVIKEYEQFFSDPLEPKDRETSLGPKSAPYGNDPVKLEFDRRIVYADVLPLY